MKQSNILKISIIALAVVLAAAAIFGSSFGLDFSDGYVVRISSPNAFGEQAAEDIRKEFGGSLGELRIQFTKENYNEQLLIHAQHMTQEDAEKMTQLAAAHAEGTYLRSFEETINTAGKKLAAKYTLILMLVTVLGAVYLWWRQGPQGCLAALAGGAAAWALSVCLQSVAGCAIGEANYLGAGMLAIVLTQMCSYLLGEGAQAAASLLAGEDAEAMAQKAKAAANGKVILMAAITAAAALVGCILGAIMLRGFMLAILLSAVAAAAAAEFVALPVYVLGAQRFLRKGGKKKAKNIK